MDGFKPLSFKACINKNFDECRLGLIAGKDLLNAVDLGVSDSTKLANLKESSRMVGVYILNGLINGLNTKPLNQNIDDISYGIGKRSIKKIAEGAGTQSPSKETIKTGQFIDEGLIIGLQNYESKVESASEDIGATSVNAVANSISAVSSAIESGIDLNPVITPILDMSNIQNGMSAMSNLDGSINVGANINSASFRASDMFGVMLDSAFNKLQKSIDRLAQDHDEVPDITININGATDPKAVAKEVEIILQKNIKGAGKVYGRA